MYFQTPTSFGIADQLPPGANVINKVIYDSLVQSAADAQAAAEQVVKEAAELEFRTAFKGSRAGGADPDQALAVSRSAGMVPAAFVPATEPFVPLGLTYETPLDLPGFGWNLDQADQVWEHIENIPDIVVGEDGSYRITLAARGVAGVADGAVAASSVVYAGVALNGTVIPGTETIVAAMQKAAGAAAPAFQTDSSGTITFNHPLVAGDVLQIFAARITSNSSVSSISSSAIGRTRIVAQRVAL